MNGKNDMSDETNKNSPTFELPVHFIKSNFFRVIHATGAWFGADGQANVHLTFFNERTAIPQVVKLSIDERGNVLGEESRQSKQGIVREMEVDVVFSYKEAIAFHKILGENLKAAEEHLKNSIELKVKAFKETLPHESNMPK